MIPGDAIPILIDPVDLTLAFEQNLALARAGGPMLALVVVGLVVGLVVLVLALAALEPYVANEGGEVVEHTPLLTACAADEFAPLATLKTAMLEYVEHVEPAR